MLRLQTPELRPESVAVGPAPATTIYLSGQTQAKNGGGQWILELREAKSLGRREILRESQMPMRSLAPLADGSLFYMGRVGQYEPSGRPELAWFYDDLRSMPKRVSGETWGHLLHAVYVDESGLVFLAPGRSRDEPFNNLVFRSVLPGATAPALAITRISPERTFNVKCSRDGQVCVEMATADPLQGAVYRTRIELHRPQGSCGLTINEHIETLAVAPDGQAFGYVSVLIDERRRRVDPRLVLLKIESGSCFSSLASKPLRAETSDGK